MRIHQGHNLESKTHSCNAHPSREKLHKLPDNVGVHIIDEDGDDGKDYSIGDTSNQLVLYNAETAHEKQREAEVTAPINHDTSPSQGITKPRYGYDSVLPAIGTYAVQCAYCFKWRVVPTKGKYEELRERICQEYFVCARAYEWNRVLSCEDPEDMSQDGSRLWAIDKPSIAQPPPGWDRELRIRGEGSSKFADVYYTSPSGKRLRSLIEIGRYLAENPDCITQGTSLSQFSFAIPKPLQEDYVRKRPYAAALELPELPEPAQVNPLSLCWPSPRTRRELFGGPGASSSNLDELDESEVSEIPAPRAKKRHMKAPAPHNKKRNLKNVSLRKCHMAPPNSFNDQH